ncbi:hypothetical protein [Sphingobium yanoikuyae]|nr:hypothetical protein [Sphingobium yanoikuyae]
MFSRATSPALRVRPAGLHFSHHKETIMANNYLKASFLIEVTPVEAALIDCAFAASDLLGDLGDEPAARLAAYSGLGSAFAAAFPPGGDDPFETFPALFVDPTYPTFDCDLSRCEPRSEGRVHLHFAGEQFAIDAVGHLLFAAAKSALPFGFEFSLDCDRLVPGQFGGGYVAITEQGVSFGHSSALLDRAIGRAIEEGADGYVLVTRHATHGLSFWNREAGFGRLADASIFSEAEASRLDIPITDDQPEWLAMPAPLI